MNNRTIPIGLTAITGRIEAVRSMADGGCHYIIFLDAGNGRSTIVEYMSDVFHQRRIRHFGGRDRFLEYQLDGSKAQLHQILTNIRSSACYTNDFEGIIAMDIAGLAKHVNEAQTGIFLEAVHDLGKHATLVFYVPTALSHNMRILIDKICATLDEVEVIRPEPYTAGQLTGIIKRMLDDAGITLTDTPELDACILELVHGFGAETIKDARLLTRKLMRCAQVSGFRPTLDADHIRCTLGGSENIKKREAV